MNTNLPLPEFKVNVWSSVVLTALLVVISTYATWAASSLGPAASFHLTHGITASWVGVCGIGISIMATILTWKGFGLNAIAALLGSTSLSSVLINANSYRLSMTTVVAVSWLVGVVYLTRRYFEHNPLWTFLALWGLTLASSLSQSVLYKYIFDHHYPLQGVLLLKFLVFSVGGLAFLLSFPRKNEDYEI